MLHALGLSASLVTGLTLLALECQVYALPSQQKVLSRPVEDSGSGLLKRFLASDVDLEKVLNIAVVRIDISCNSP